MGSTLSAHVDTALVTYDQLKSIEAPGSTRYWRPVQHIELVDTLKAGLTSMGMRVEREQFAIGSEGRKLFGTFDIEGKDLVNGVGSALGFRHSNDKRIAIQIVGGGRVFVCDNMMLSGDVTLLKQKHTWGYSLRNLVERGLSLWQNKRERFIGNVERLVNTPITDDQARALLAKGLYDGVTTFQTFKIAYDLYFTKAVIQPELFADCAPRTAWGLHNAFTRALKESTPNAAFNTNIALGNTFGI